MKAKRRFVLTKCLGCGAKFAGRSGAAQRCDACRQTYRRPVIVPPEQVSARKIYGKALRDGALVRQCCEKCGKSPSHGHHEDYSRPLDVVWLCPMHHIWRHHEIARGRVSA